MIDYDLEKTRSATHTCPGMALCRGRNDNVDSIWSQKCEIDVFPYFSDPHRMNSPPASSRILLADDDRLFGKFVTRSLRPYGFVITTATTVEKALSLVAVSGERGFAAMLLDVRLPHCRDIQLPQRCRTILPRMRLIIVGEQSDTDFPDQRIEFGADAQVLKSCGLETLVSAIEAASPVPTTDPASCPQPNPFIERDEDRKGMSRQHPATPKQTRTQLNELQGRLDNAVYSELKTIRVSGNAEHVVIRGRVASYYLKQLAQHIALETAGVKSVTNEIAVG